MNPVFPFAAIVAAVCVASLIAHLTGLKLRWRNHISRRAVTRYDNDV